MTAARWHVAVTVVGCLAVAGCTPSIGGGACRSQVTCTVGEPIELDGEVSLAVTDITIVARDDIPDDAIDVEMQGAAGHSSLLVIAQDASESTHAIRLGIMVWADAGSHVDVRIEAHLGNGGEPATMPLEGFADASCVTGGAETCTYYLVPATVPSDETSVSAIIESGSTSVEVIAAP